MKKMILHLSLSRSGTHTHTHISTDISIIQYMLCYYLISNRKKERKMSKTEKEI